MALDALAAAYAATGDYERAISEATRAHDLSQRAGVADLTEQIDARLRLYRREQPYRQGSS